jgi:phage gp36-like protein
MPYLTASEYLERYTEAETVRLTDTTQTGVVDDAKVDTVIADVTEFADAYLAGRYVLPIASPPELLKGIVADLARERLHGLRATPAVTANADRARKLLTDLSAGRANIPAPAAGSAPETNSSDSPVTSGDARARVFTDASLADYTGFGSGSYGGTVFGPGPRGW